MKKRQFPEHFNSVNDILMEWNPLGVDGPILSEEYLTIIPMLLKLRNDKNKLKEFLTATFDRKYGVKYSQTELEIIINKIYSLK